MANFKRKRARRHVRCTICTPGRMGNSTKNAPRRVLIAHGKQEAK
jgi:hypothetical protein